MIHNVKSGRLIALVAAIATTIALIGYLFAREHMLLYQRSNGYAASGNPAGAPLHSHVVFSVGNLFLTYDSTEINSPLWLVPPAETLRSWLWPEPNRKFQFE